MLQRSAMAAHLQIEWRNHPFEFDGLPGRA
jgi:hypothetical protein